MQLTPSWHVAVAYFTARELIEMWLCVYVCVEAAMSTRWMPKPPGPSSAQVKHSDEVDQEQPPFAVVWD